MFISPINKFVKTPILLIKTSTYITIIIIFKDLISYLSRKKFYISNKINLNKKIKKEMFIIHHFFINVNSCHLIYHLINGTDL